MPDQLQNQLAVLARAQATLAEAKSLSVVKEVRDKAEAARSYAKSALLGLSIQNRAAELKLRAERRAGELLSQLDFSPGGRTARNRSRESTSLRDLGINKSQSSRWQREAKVPSEVFEEYVKRSQHLGREISAQGLLKLAASGRRVPGVGQTTRAVMPSTIRATTGDLSRCTCGQTLFGDVAELLVDLNGHWGTLAGILDRLCEESQTLRTKERKYYRKLHRETSDLIHRLEKLVAESQ